MFKGKKIVLGITGSIAAYKAVLLVRLLVKEGAEVKVIMTPSARDFVSPLTLSTLSKQPVLSEMFDEQGWTNHVMLGRWADVMVIAPLSCHTLSGMARGACDNLLLAVYLSATCPVVVAPAMDEDMWKHPATRENIKKIESFGNLVMPVGNGELASGLTGEGRMAEPEEIAKFLHERFFLTGPIGGKNVLVTAGPTYEAIDPVRFIGNHSSGKMGIAIAREMKARGAKVKLILGPTNVDENLDGIEVTRVQSAKEMYHVCNELFENIDIAIMAAAVADYRPEQVASQKIKKTKDTMELHLVKNPDILKSLGEKKKNGQVVVGFALETMNEEASAKQKLISKNADLMVMNSLNDAGAGFGHDTNKITIYSNKGEPIEFGLRSKKQVAGDIADTISKLFYA